MSTMRMRHGEGAPGLRSGLGRRVGGAAAVAALALLAGCTAGGHPAGGRPAGQTAPAANTKAPTAASGPRVTITPGNGAADANPSAGITVTAAGGTLKNVTVRTSGDAVSGSLSQGGRVWHSTWTLDVSQAYTVTATASGGGRTVTAASAFRTLTPTQTFRTEILNGYKQTYGVGAPIVLYFSQKVTNRAAVERALQVTTSKPVVGAWYWDDSCGMAPTCAYFRPRDYWPTGTTVSFTGHLDGVQAAPGVYGYHTLTQTFSIGPSLIAIGNVRTHHTQIYYNGKLRYDWPISAGRPGDDTPDGSYLTIDKHNPVLMTGPGYSLEVPYSVRFTWSGDYYHDAYWSVAEQGYTNVSHGCVNLPPADAEIYYNLAVPGDPITIVGSPKAGTFDNGWTMWFLSWPQYLKGSALGMAVQAGPSGSTFVNPSSLPPDTATAPLQTAPVGNAAAD